MLGVAASVGGNEIIHTCSSLAGVCGLTRRVICYFVRRRRLFCRVDTNGGTEQRIEVSYVNGNSL